MNDEEVAAVFQWFGDDNECWVLDLDMPVRFFRLCLIVSMFTSLYSASPVKA
jgi:hypothetical protein